MFIKDRQNLCRFIWDYYAAVLSTTSFCAYVDVFLTVVATNSTLSFADYKHAVTFYDSIWTSHLNIG